MIHEIETEFKQDREMEKAYREATRAENCIKYRAEIQSRPRAEWKTSKKEKQEIKQESFKDLKNIKEKFIGKSDKKEWQKDKKPDKKRQAKESQKAQQVAKKGGSKFTGDFETDHFEKKKKLSQEEKDANKKPQPLYEQTDKSYKGKRRSMGAKFAGFRGEKSLKDLKKNMKK